MNAKLKRAGSIGLAIVTAACASVHSRPTKEDHLGDSPGAYPPTKHAGFASDAALGEDVPSTGVCHAGVECQEVAVATVAGLLQAPVDFDGKMVRVVGFVVLPHEGTATYPNEKDARLRRRWRGIYLDMNQAVHKNARPACDGVTAVVEGVFQGFEHGFGGLFPGEIAPVTLIRATE